jgi:hypothetical protein
MRPSRLRVIFAIAISLTCTSARAAGHKEFIATPGLWKITYRTRINGQPDPVILKWRCVSEEQMEDPASVFAKPAAAHGSCQRTSYTQTGTTARWQYHCASGTTSLDSQGVIKFDTPLHYTGEIKLDGVVMGYPIQNVVTVEGVHRAACTSPED